MIDIINELRDVLGLEVDETETELLLDDEKDEVIFYHKGYISALECLLAFIDVENPKKEEIIKYSKLQIEQEKKYIKYLMEEK